MPIDCPRYEGRDLDVVGPPEAFVLPEAITRAAATPGEVGGTPSCARCGALRAEATLARWRR